MKWGEVRRRKLKLSLLSLITSRVPLWRKLCKFDYKTNSRKSLDREVGGATDHVTQWQTLGLVGSWPMTESCIIPLQSRVWDVWEEGERFYKFDNQTSDSRERYWVSRHHSTRKLSSVLEVIMKIGFGFLGINFLLFNSK